MNDHLEKTAKSNPNIIVWILKRKKAHRIDSVLRGFQMGTTKKFFYKVLTKIVLSIKPASAGLGDWRISLKSLGEYYIDSAGS